MGNKLSFDLEKLLQKTDGDSMLVTRRPADVVGMRRAEFVDFLERVRELEMLSRIVELRRIVDETPAYDAPLSAWQDWREKARAASLELADLLSR